MNYNYEDIKKLGFGLMRLPKKDGAADIEQLKQMVDMFLGAGFTYFDTAWAYDGSEDAIRQALVERYPRDKFLLATKNAAWIGCRTRDEAMKQFDTSLSRTGAKYFDFYLLHNLGEMRTKYFDDFDMWSWAAEKKREGLIKNLGFSFHSTADELETILSAHPDVDFVQLQINYADWESPSIQSGACYETARRHGKRIVIMEPVKGGNLATPPDSIAAILRQADPGASFASWAIRFAASLDGVITVLSGMSSVDQMADNIAYMKDFSPLTDAERGTIEKARKALEKIPVIPCTSCDYCAKVCPNNIGISGTFTAANIATLYGNMPLARHQASWLVGGHGKKRASECIGCGKCEMACPQHIAIRDELKKAVEILK